MACRSKVESSGFQQSRKFRFWGLLGNPHGMFAQLRWGRAWRSAQSRGDGVGSGSKSAQALQTAIKTRVVSTGRRGGPSWTTPASGETPERRLWAIKRARLPNGVSLVLSDQLPQSRSRTLEEALHPRTLASRVVFCTGLFTQDWFWSGPGGVAWGDVEIATLIASLQLPIQPEFHAQAPHTGLRLLARDLIALASKRKRIVIGDHTLLDMAQDCGQLLGWAQGAMLVRKILYWARETLVPLRPILVLQKRVGGFEVCNLGQAQLLDQPVLRGQETAFHAAFGLRRKGRNPADAQFPQAASELSQPVGHLALLFAFPFSRRDGEHRVTIGVDVYHAPVLVQVFPQHRHVEARRVAFHKAAPTPTGGVIDHPHQIATRSSPFQPVVLGGVPLHQFAERAAPGTPTVNLLKFPAARCPQAGLGHPGSNRFLADVDFMQLGQLFGGQCGAEVVPVRLPQDGQGLLPRRGRDLPVRCTAAQSMHHHRVPSLFHPL